MKNALLVVGGILWFGLVFSLTFWLTFPSDTLAERLKYEVYDGSGGDYQLQLDSLSPWWVGVSGEMVQLYSNTTPRGGGDPVSELVFAAEAARLRVSPLSLLRRTPSVAGGMTIGGGDVDFTVATQMDKKDRLGVSDLTIEAQDFPIIDLASLAGTAMEGTGTIDIEVEISAPDGMRQAEGKIEIHGGDILITKLDPAAMGGMDLGMEIPLDDIDIVLDITQGKAEFTRGKIRSQMANIDLDGALTLRDDLTRSTMNIGLVVELGEELAMFKSFLNDAKGADEKFHYKCAGTLSRMPRCSGQRVGRRDGGTRRSTPAASGNSRRQSGGARAETSAEDREKRREEIRERLRQRREGSSGSSERPTKSERRDDEGDDDDYEGDDDDIEGDDDDFEGDDDDYEGEADEEFDE